MAKNRKAEVDAVLPEIDFSKHNYQLELDTTEGKITLDMLPDVAPDTSRTYWRWRRSDSTTG